MVYNVWLLRDIVNRTKTTDVPRLVHSEMCYCCEQYNANNTARELDV